MELEQAPCLSSRHEELLSYGTCLLADLLCAPEGAAGGPANSSTLSGGRKASPEVMFTTRDDLHRFWQSALTPSSRCQSQAMKTAARMHSLAPLADCPYNEWLMRDSAWL